MGLVAAPLRLGLLSTANISVKLLAGAAQVEDVEVVAVGGRDRERAAEFAAAHGIPRAYGSYNALLADTEVDAVYVALPNALHAEWAMRAVQAGKHVLVEKPLSTDPAEVEALFATAERQGVVVMEGFMWRHQPQVARLVELVGGGAVGALREVRAAFSFSLHREVDVRWESELGAAARCSTSAPTASTPGACWPASPSRPRAVSVLAPGGADVRFAGVLRHPGGVPDRLRLRLRHALPGVGRGDRRRGRRAAHRPLPRRDAGRRDLSQWSPGA